MFMIKFFICLVFLSGLFCGCPFRSDPVNRGPNIPVQAGGKTMQNEDIRTKSWDEITTLLKGITLGTSNKQVISILGEPHMRQYEDLNAQYNDFKYLERPNDVGMMNYVEFIMDNGFVQDINLGEISVDPW